MELEKKRVPPPGGTLLVDGWMGERGGEKKEYVGKVEEVERVDQR